MATPKSRKPLSRIEFSSPDASVRIPKHICGLTLVAMSLHHCFRLFNPPELCPSTPIEFTYRILLVEILPNKNITIRPLVGPDKNMTESGVHHGPAWPGGWRYTQ